jgi:hypothetical protein
LLATGFGFSREVLMGDPAEVLTRLRDTSVLQSKPASVSPDVQRLLTATLDREVDRLVMDTFRTKRTADALDHLIEGDR